VAVVPAEENIDEDLIAFFNDYKIAGFPDLD